METKFDLRKHVSKHAEKLDTLQTLADAVDQNCTGDIQTHFNIEN
jgi:hypothetical protein